MEGQTAWNHRPYLPPDHYAHKGAPYIVRIAPHEDRAEVEVVGDGVHSRLRYKKSEEEGWLSVQLSHPKTVLGDLDAETTYMIYAEDASGRRSHTRLFTTGKMPWTVVNYLHPKDDQYAFSGRFLCSPSVVRLKDGVLLMSCDLYEQMGAQNLTLLFRSTDNGVTWRYLTELMPCFWGKLFLHKDVLYMLGMSTEYGDVLIGRSTDGGENWSAPTVLFRGTSCVGRGWHRAPCTILHANKRLYTSLEYGAWGKGDFAVSVLSIDENADLMQAKNWTAADFWSKPGVSAIEGNLVYTPQGRVWNILRYREGEAVVLEVSKDGKSLSDLGTMAFPAAHTKFEIQQKADGSYVAVGNDPPMRNVLSVYTSSDLKEWKKYTDVIDGRPYDAQYVGFQYPSFLLEGDEVLIASRTAFHGADSFHNNNFLTFHKVSLSKL